VGAIKVQVQVRRRQLVRFAYGTDGRLGDQFLVDPRWRLARRRHPLPAPPTRQRAEAARPVADRALRDGWAMLPPRDPGLIASIVEGFDAIIDREGHGFDMGPRIRDCVRYLSRPVDRLPQLRLVLDEPTVDVLRAYYGTGFRLQHVRLWRIGHVPDALAGEHHYGNLWHTDQHPVTSVKIFVQLSDVAEVGGAFRFYDIPDTRRLLRPLPGRLGAGPGFRWRQDDLPDHVRLFDAPPGAAVLINTCRCLHRAGIPKPGMTRRMLQFTFDIAADPPPAELFAGLPDDPGVGPDRSA